MTDSPRFIADAMLGSLARKLRIFGFDCRYFRHGDDQSLMAVARKDGRTILTFDRGLAGSADRRGIPCFLLYGTTDLQRLGSLAHLADSLSVQLRAGKTRCPLCNRVLRRTTKKKLTVRVSEGTLKRHRIFYECSHCWRAFWKGRHWTRLRKLSRAVDGKKNLTHTRSNGSDVAHRPAR